MHVRRRLKLVRSEQEIREREFEVFQKYMKKQKIKFWIGEGIGIVFCVFSVVFINVFASLFGTDSTNAWTYTILLSICISYFITSPLKAALLFILIYFINQIKNPTWKGKLYKLAITTLSSQNPFDLYVLAGIPI